MNTSLVSLDHLLANAADGLLMVDRSRRVVMFSKGCERITGYGSDEVLGFECKCFDALKCHDEQGRSLAGALCPARALFDGSSADSACQRMRIRRKDGEPAWLETNYAVVRDEAGEVEFVLGVMRDIETVKAKEDLLIQEMSELRERVVELSRQQKSRYGFDNIVSKSPAMEPVFEKIRAALSNSSTVLISGESGTGKEVVARTIHVHGLQSDGPFVPLNCSALPRDLIESELFGHVRGAFTGATHDHPGLFRAAENGTLFLDEIGQMPPMTQSKLLRALQDKRVRPVGSTDEIRVQVRVIAAMNRSPQAAIKDGSLREDLYYRLDVIGLALPRLRDRREDIPLLVESFVEAFNRTGLRQIKEVAPAAWDAMLSHTWPGNIRELSNAVESAFALGEGPVLERRHLPPEVCGERPTNVPREAGESLLLDPHLNQVEREAIFRALGAAGGQRNKAAKLMGISRSRLYRRMDALGIDPGRRHL